MPAPAPAPRFSIIIPAWNEAANLPACVESITRAAGERHHIELLLVDNGSTDSTRDLAVSLGLRVLANPAKERVTIAALRNKGAAEAAGDILCFLDADMRVPEGWLDAVAAVFDAGHKGLLGFVETTPTKITDAGAKDLSRSSEELPAVPWTARVWGERYRLRRPGQRPVTFLPGRNLCVSKVAFLDVGGFDESLVTSEDKDLTLRMVDAGYGAMSSDAVVLTHLGYERSFLVFVRKEFWRQGGSLALARKHDFRRRTLRQPIMAAGHLFCLVLFFACLLGMGTALGMFYLAVLWITPSALSIWGGPAIRSPWLALQLTILMFVRWNVAACALVWQLLREARPVKD